MLAALSLPASNTILLFGSAAILDIELVTDPTLLLDPNVLHNELHAACLTGAILLSAVLAERTPLEVATLVDLLVKEAHIVGETLVPGLITVTGAHVSLYSLGNV